MLKLEVHALVAFAVLWGAGAVSIPGQVGGAPKITGPSRAFAIRSPYRLMAGGCS